MRGASVEPDAETYSWFREYSFRKTFGGSHAEFIEQPVSATEWLLAIDKRLSDLADKG